MKSREAAKGHDEQSWTTGWRRVLAVFKNRTGLGKRVKRAMNKRQRRKVKRIIEHGQDD